eukprot:2134430-Pyramimonas_sp.AAC.1
MPFYCPDRHSMPAPPREAKCLGPHWATSKTRRFPSSATVPKLPTSDNLRVVFWELQHNEDPAGRQRIDKPGPPRTEG